MMYLDDFLMPDAFIDGLPDPAKKRVRKYGVLDFAFERYRDVAELKDKQYSPMPMRFFAPYSGGEQYFDFHEKDEHNIAREPSEEELKQKGKSIPVLPKDWWKAFVFHYPDPTLDEKKKKRERDLSLVKILAVFDFDETLFRSDHAAKRLETDHPLSPDSLPDIPKESDWNLDIVYRAQELCSNPAVYCVMMTGRVGDRFKDKIDKLLRDRNIFFAETHYNEFGGDTAKYKIETIHNIMSKLPNVKRLRMWEDQQEKADKYIEEFSQQIDFKINMVGEENP